MMMMRNGRAVVAMLALAAVLAGCDSTPAGGGSVAQGNAPEGTISDELPDLDLLPNDAPLADPADQGLVPGAPGAVPLVPGASVPGEAATTAPPPATPVPAPVVEDDDSVAE